MNDKTHKLELFFLNILRGTVMATAAIAFFISVGSFLYALYAAAASPPNVSLSNRLYQLQATLVPENMFKDLVGSSQSDIDERTFEQIITGVRTNVATPSVVAGSQRENLLKAFQSYNRFLTSAFSVRIADQNKFDTLVFSSERSFNWSQNVDSDGLFNDAWAASLTAFLNHIELYDSNIAKLNSATKIKIQNKVVDQGYVFNFFATKVKNFVRGLEEEYQNKMDTYNSLKAYELVAFYSAAAAFGYFIIVMFVFVFIRIEIDLRMIAQGLNSAAIKVSG